MNSANVFSTKNYIGKHIEDSRYIKITVLKMVSLGQIPTSSPPRSPRHKFSILAPLYKTLAPTYTEEDMQAALAQLAK